MTLDHERAAAVRLAAARAWRDESPRILPGLIRILGDWSLAEEALQDAFERALCHWQDEGIPQRPGAWLMTTARRRALDLLRSHSRARAHKVEVQWLGELDGGDDVSAFERVDQLLDESVADDQLRALFACCHESLDRDAQIALTLSILGGLQTTEIAAAFLQSVPTMAQRLTRAKRKIRDAGIPFRSPTTQQVRERLPSVLHTIYLIFNEGYSATHGSQLLRRELCEEAIRLATLLCELLAEAAEPLGLLALLRLQHSRRDARTSTNGTPILLAEQDRTQWHHTEIEQGVTELDRAIALRQTGPFQVQAAIAALHAQARSSQQTDWPQIAALYAGLREWMPNSIVALNHAVAVSFAESPAAALGMLDPLQDDPILHNYRYFHSARADLLRQLERWEEARLAYQRALECCENSGERQFLRTRLEEVARRQS